MSDVKIDLAHRAEAQLGETCLWDARTGLLGWIDIEQPRFYTLDPATGATTSVAHPGTYLGCQALTRSGRQLLARDLTLITCDADGSDVRVLAETPGEAMPDTRLNDGRVDAQGRLWIGTMDNELHRGLGHLYRVDPDGTMTAVLGDVIVSNGIAFDPQGRWMWFTDTRRHLTWKIHLDADGTVTGRDPWADYSASGGRPDGACVDADGCLWQAMFGGGRVVRYAPDGRIDRDIALPVTNPTCLCFGGPDLSTLFVTSATKFLTPEQRATEPLAGSVLAIHGAGQGMPENLFNI
ncbi:SMP-30/gluconolactonase/LRE family protein [Pseudooceanicola onchidii]|uniref:SMP-30/gluconolactonase/LRE family protein n=1 Tax=Pseudooceanicola onchidii TaxID=2562279 RepID=UPI0010AA5C40|nr:SMP-30/gluconolactonase/LRE family protein [Pseudooceanicola onchidii]